MAGAIRYRRGFDERTGKLLVGAPHLGQSLRKIWQTRLGTRVMRLAFGSDLRSLLAEDLTPEIALLLYNEMVVNVARWEPEYQLTQLQLVKITEGGALGLRHGGDYFPEGRLGNYDLKFSIGIETGTVVRLA